MATAARRRITCAIFDPDRVKIGRRQTPWLDTVHVTLPASTILELPPGEVLCSQPYPLQGRPEVYVFQLIKCEDDSLCATALRTHPPSVGPFDTGYFTRFSFTVIGFCDRISKDASMQDDEDSACVFFKNSSRSIRRKLEQFQMSEYVFDLKVVIKLVECSPTYDEAYERQEGLLSEFRKTLGEEEVRDMGIIVTGSVLEDVFYGRMPNDRADLRLEMIKRTAPYASKVLQYLKTRHMPDTVYPPDFSQMINFLVNGTEGPLSDYDALMAYVLAQTLWLPHLIFIARDEIISRLDRQMNFHGVGMLLEALMVSDNVGDRELFDIAAFKYVERIRVVNRLPEFQKAFNERPQFMRSVTHNVTIYMETQYDYDKEWR